MKGEGTSCWRRLSLEEIMRSRNKKLKSMIGRSPEITEHAMNVLLGSK